MKGLLTRRQRRKAERAFAAFARSAKETEAALGAMMQEIRGSASGWLAAIEEMERENPAEAARIPAGTKDFCEAAITRSADAQLALGDALAAVMSVHRALEDSI